MSDLFQQLLAEAKDFQAKAKKKAKTKSQSRNGKTYSESKKARIQRTKNSLLHVKERINSQHDQIILGSLRKEFLEILIHTDTCSSCRSVHRRVVHTQVWSKATRGEHLDPWRMTSEIRGLGELQCNNTLPVRKLERNRFIPICADCADKLTEKQPWKG